MNRNVLFLAICQGLMTSGNILLVTISALVGQALSPSSAFTTLPVATQMLGLLLTTVPASLLMAKIGRKRGFSLGNLIGISGTVLGFYSLLNSQFWLFALATFLIGVGIGFATLYRFAAIEAFLNRHGLQPLDLVFSNEPAENPLNANVLASASRKAAIPSRPKA